MKEQGRRLTREHPEFPKRKGKLKEFHKKLIGRAISVIKPLRVLNKINEENLKGKGEVTKQSFPYLETFNLSWTDSYVELSGYLRHQITIAFCPFLIGPNQVIKNVDQVYPGFVVLGGSEAKAIRKISSLNPNLSTIFGIPTRLGEINKVNLIKEIGPSLEEALKKAYRNSALKK